MLRKALTIYALYVCGCILFELAERRAYRVVPLNEVHSAAEGSVREQRLKSMMESTAYVIYLFGTLAASLAVFIGGLFLMRKPLQPMAGNPVTAHFIHLPLLFFPAIACLAFMAPPWGIPFLVDGRSIGEMIQALHSIR